MVKNEEKLKDLTGLKWFNTSQWY